MKTLLFLIITFAIYTEQKSTPESDHYKGAVVEYMVNRNTTENLQNYINLIANASKEDVDVIVFPEMTLYGGLIEVPIHGDLKEYPVPAEHPDKYHNVLVKLSEAAKRGQLYVIVNIQEVMNCSIAAEAEECPDNKTYSFNTNVVVDRNGAVIDRYRKINLFGEFSRSPALKPDLGIFTTDFGVTFGHFICFDLLFQIPAKQVIEKHNITDVLFPTMWFSELPYLTAVQIQEAYAYAGNINFLAAGANNVRIGSAGSGIYSGKAGALISIMPATPTTRMLVADIPKIPGMIKTEYPGHIAEDPNIIDRLAMKRDPSLGAHKTKLLVAGNNEFTLDYEDMKCNFKVNFNYKTSDQKPFVRAFVHDGFNTYATRILGTTSCSIITCKDADPKSCSHKYEGNQIEFESIHIEYIGLTPTYNDQLKCHNSIYYPATFKNNRFPLPSRNYTYTTEKIDAVRSKITISSTRQEIVVFGIWGRVFTRDAIDETITAEDLKEFDDDDAFIFKDAAEIEIKERTEL